MRATSPSETQIMVDEEPARRQNEGWYVHEANHCGPRRTVISDLRGDGTATRASDVPLSSKRTWVNAGGRLGTILSGAFKHPSSRGPFYWVNPSGEHGVMNETSAIQPPLVSWVNPDGVRAGLMSTRVLRPSRV